MSDCETVIKFGKVSCIWKLFEEEQSREGVPNYTDRVNTGLIIIVTLIIKKWEELENKCIGDAHNLRKN